MNTQGNLLLAVVLSLLILVGFEIFYNQPRWREQQAIQSFEDAQSAAVADLPGGKGTTKGDALGPPVPSQPDAVIKGPPAQKVKEDPRIPIDTPSLHGSFSLNGGRIDDITLADYRVSLAADSPEITLLAPRQAPDPYFARHGWSASDPNIATPDADTPWTADGQGLTPDTPVTLTWDNGQGLVFRRHIAVDRRFMFTLTDDVENRGSTPVTLYPYALLQRIGTPPTLNFFILHEGPLGVMNGVLEEYDYDDLAEVKKVQQETTGGWLGMTGHYWLAAIAPDQKEAVEATFAYGKRDGRDTYQVNYLGSPNTVQPGQRVETTHYLFAGAKEVRVLSDYAETLGIDRFDLAVDFGYLYFLTKPLFHLIAFFNDFLGNFGLAILALTVVIRLVLYPLADKSFRSMNAMKKISPEMMQLRERYADDRIKLNQEMITLYKRHKVNPAAGCLPILIQIPIFFALYKVLFVSIEMRHAPFFGWIKDLSAPDPTSLFNLFGLLPWEPPLFLTIGVWPLLMGLTMFIQQKLNPPPPDPVQAKIFMMLPFVFTILLAGFPAGLVIYWTWNNLLSILQQRYLMLKMERADSKAEI